MGPEALHVEHSGATLEMQILIWISTTVFLLLLGLVGYLYRQNDKIKQEAEHRMISSIKDSIDKLSETIKGATNEFKHTVSEIWEHIGSLQSDIDWMIGQHEINHQIEKPEKQEYVVKRGPQRPYFGPDRRKIGEGDSTP